MASSTSVVPMKVGESRRDYLQRAAKWCREQYKRQRQTESCHPSHTAQDVLQNVVKRFTDLGTFGVEGWCDDCGRDGWQYLNAGDTYSLTVLFCSESERFSVGCWGDVVERLG